MTLKELLEQEYTLPDRWGGKSPAQIQEELNLADVAAVVGRLDTGVINQYLNDNRVVRKGIRALAIAEPPDEDAIALREMLVAETGGSISGASWQEWVAALPSGANSFKAAMSALADTTTSKAAAAGLGLVHHSEIATLMREIGAEDEAA